MVGLYKNSRKMFGMIPPPCRVVGNQLEATYNIWMTGGGLIYWAQQKLRVQCPEFGADRVAGLLEVHWQTHHVVEKGMEGEEQWDTPPHLISRSKDVSDFFPECGGNAELSR